MLRGSLLQSTLPFLRPYLLVLVTMLAIMVLSYVVALRQFRVDTIATRSIQLENSASLIDARMLEVSRLALEIADDPRLPELRQYQASRSVSAIYNVLGFKESFVSHNSELVHDIYVYVVENDLLVMPAHAGTRVDLAYESMIAYSGLSFDEWKQRLFLGYRGRTVWPSGNVAGGTDVLSFLQTFPVDKPVSPDGVIVLLVDIERLLAHAGVREADVGGVFEMLSRDGKLLVSSERSHDSEGRSSIVLNAESLFHPWNYRYTVPEASIVAKIGLMRRTFVLIALAAIILGAVVSVVLAYRASIPVSRVNRSLGLALRNLTPATAGGMAAIEEGVRHLSSQSAILQRSVALYAPLAKATVIGRILRGAYLYENDLDSELERLDIRIAGRSYLILVVGIVYSASEHGVTNSGHINSGMIVESAAHIIRRRFLWYVVDADRIALLIPDPGEMENGVCPALDDKLLGLQTRLADAANVTIRVGVGNPCTRLIDTAMSYQQAVEAYDCIRKEDNLVWYSLLPKESRGPSYPLETQQRLMSLVEMGDTDEAVALWAHLCHENLAERQLSVQDSSDFVSEVASTFRRIERSVIRERRDDTIRHVIVRFRSAKTYDATYERGCEAIRVLSSASEQSRRNHNSELLSRLREFVDGNFMDWHMSLTLLSEHFNLTEQYISSFFHEQTGSRFHSYVSRLRMKRARDLMEAGMSVTDAGRQVGYQNLASFSRAFKRHWGFAPSTFRHRMVDSDR